MPNFPPGTPVTGNSTPIPQLVFTPTPNAQASVRIQNTGGSPVYVGGTGVTPLSGFAILPGNRPIELQNVNTPVYVCSGVTGTSSVSTLSSATAQGIGTIATAGTLPGAGWYQIGNGTGIEYAYVPTAPASLNATLSTHLLYDHATGATVSTVSPVPTGFVATAGVL